jgi:hypothetical protein
MSAISIDIPLELPESLSTLTETYKRLLKERVANGLKRSYINLSSLLSNVLQQRVLTLCSNDDGLDFSCLTESGLLISLVALCGKYIVRFEQGAQVLLEPRPEARQLHELVSEHLRACFGIDGAELGVGSWDGPEWFGSQSWRQLGSEL